MLIEPDLSSHDRKSHRQFAVLGLEREIWRWAPVPITTSEAMQNYAETALHGQAEGTALPFATVLNETNQVVGSTRLNGHVK